MNLSDANYFGPQPFVAIVRISQRINATRYGYESKGHLYDVCLLSEPVQCDNGETVQRYYKDNGKMVNANQYHWAIEKHFNLINPS